MATGKVTVYGLPIAAARKVNPLYRSGVVVNFFIRYALVVRDHNVTHLP